jgi:hypothetical protein
MIRGQPKPLRGTGCAIGIRAPKVVLCSERVHGTSKNRALGMKLGV